MYDKNLENLENIFSDRLTILTTNGNSLLDYRQSTRDYVVVVKNRPFIIGLLNVTYWAVYY